MRPKSLYYAVVGPAAAWVALHHLLGLWFSSLDLAREPTPVERVLAAVTVWEGRMMPFALILGVVVTPFLTLVAAGLLRAPMRKGSEGREVLRWIAVLIGSWLAVVALIAVERATTLALALFWSGAIAQALVVAVAYRWQKALYDEGLTSIPGWVVVWSGFGLQVFFVLPGFLIGLLPFVIARRPRPQRELGEPAGR